MKNEHGWARLVMKIMARGGMRLNKTKELRTNALTGGEEWAWVAPSHKEGLMGICSRKYENLPAAIITPLVGAIRHRTRFHTYIHMQSSDTPQKPCYTEAPTNSAALDDFVKQYGNTNRTPWLPPVGWVASHQKSAESSH